jgi:hypothetical protein
LKNAFLSKRPCLMNFKFWLLYFTSVFKVDRSSLILQGSGVREWLIAILCKFYFIILSSNCFCSFYNDYFIEFFYDILLIIESLDFFLY